MGHFDIELFISRPREAVFDYLADVESTPEWYSAVKEAKRVDSEQTGLGARYEITRDLPQGRVSDVVDVTTFERPDVFEFGTEVGSTPFRYRYELSDQDNGTLLHLSGDITLSGKMKLLSPLATQAFKRGMRSNLESLKAIVESR